MGDMVMTIGSEVWYLLKEMAPYLLFGFMMAGVLHVLIPRERIFAHFSQNTIWSVVKAALFGVPLPLCSCGVIPVAAHLRKQGASRGATISFLSSTPTTGVDSILATYSLLGPLFAVIRPVAAFFAGFLSGSVTSLVVKGEEAPVTQEKTGMACELCIQTAPHSHPLAERGKSVLHYAFVELLGETATWLVIGILIGGVLGAVLPQPLIGTYLGTAWLSYPLMLVTGIIMYVCATGSIPIAASLIAKGMSPGAGLIFLIVGPATNTATLSFVAGRLGKKTLVSYLAALSFTALVFGLALDGYWHFSGQGLGLISGGRQMLPAWLKFGSALVLVYLIGQAFVLKRIKREEARGMGTVIRVPDMTCDHCKRTITAAVSNVEGVEHVAVDIKAKRVAVTGRASAEAIRQAIRAAGYTAEKL
jgi:uncharacterized membrane protein YraQ (UPF0718 family)/copper chaperone CopZ